MKKIGLMMLVLMGVVSAQASQLYCAGRSVKSPDPAWLEKAMVTATLVDSERLDRLTLMSQVGNSAPASNQVVSVRSDAQYKARNPSYQGFNRFALSSDGWTQTYLLLPSNATQLRQFRGYIQQVGHDSYPLIILNCAQR
jgi:hypothetical protein